MGGELSHLHFIGSLIRGCIPVKVRGKPGSAVKKKAFQMHVKQSSAANCLPFSKAALSHSFLHANSLRERQECKAKRYQQI